jgi:hypothetical protein
LVCINCGKPTAVDDSPGPQDTQEHVASFIPDPPVKGAKKKRIAFQIAIAALASAAILCGCLQGYYWHRSSLEKDGPPLGEHRYQFVSIEQTSTKRLALHNGSNPAFPEEDVLHLYNIQQTDSIFRPTFLVLRSIAPSDIRRCPSVNNPLANEKITLRREEGSAVLSEVGSECTWREDTATFESQVSEIFEKTMAAENLRDSGRFSEFNELVGRGAEFGESFSMEKYIEVQVFSADVWPAEVRQRYGAVSYDLDRAEFYLQILKGRKGDFSPKFHQIFDELNRMMAKTFVAKAGFYHDRDQQGDFARSSAWNARAADLGSPDGMNNYILECWTVYDLNRGNTGPAFAPEFAPNRARAVQYLNTLIAMNDAHSLTAEQQHALSTVKELWTEEMFSRPAQEVATTPRDGVPSSQ